MATRGEWLAEATRRNGDRWQPTRREAAEQAVCRASVRLAKWADGFGHDRRQLERAREDLDEALRLTA